MEFPLTEHQKKHVIECLKMLEGLKRKLQILVGQTSKPNEGPN